MTDFNSTGWIALFENHQADVEGWDLVTHAALVVDPDRGVMRPVTEYPDFRRLIMTRKIAGMMPCRAGYRAYWENRPGDPIIEEIVGWIVSVRGDVIPFTPDGTAHDATILEPGQDLPPAT
ncbi:hypothetical protein GCM10010365_46590 [Streptomyces poonensis]|uniref:Uncharacterized protein n=1 Tax=Streptomyces poonensis TaxID=68255 RepID=A0A918PSA5_9ACTN|nr:hypothetical protein GCM10010365_46590 [Streptomyces poonensis]